MTGGAVHHYNVSIHDSTWVSYLPAIVHGTLIVGSEVYMGINLIQNTQIYPSLLYLLAYSLLLTNFFLPPQVENYFMGYIFQRSYMIKMRSLHHKSTFRSY